MRSQFVILDSIVQKVALTYMYCSHNTSTCEKNPPRTVLFDLLWDHDAYFIEQCWSARTFKNIYFFIQL